MDINPYHLQLPQLFLCDNTVRVATSVKLLGVIFSDDLKFTKHFSDVYMKCIRGMAAVKKLYFSGFKGEMLWKIYLALVFSHLSYCWPAVCNISQKDMNKFCLLEKRACRLCDKSYSASQLQDRLKSICIKLMNKVKNDIEHPIRNCFSKRTDKVTLLRNSPSLLPMATTPKIMKSFAQFYHFS